MIQSIQSEDEVMFCQNLSADILDEFLSSKTFRDRFGNVERWITESGEGWSERSEKNRMKKGLEKKEERGLINRFFQTWAQEEGTKFRS